MFSEDLFLVNDIISKPMSIWRFQINDNDCVDPPDGKG